MMQHTVKSASAARAKALPPPQKKVGEGRKELGDG